MTRPFMKQSALAGASRKYADREQFVTINRTELVQTIHLPITVTDALLS